MADNKTVKVRTCNCTVGDACDVPWHWRDIVEGEPSFSHSDGFAQSPAYQSWSQSVNEMQNWVRRINERNGWYDTKRDFATDMALLHSEVSEAYEGWRKGDDVNVAEELADVFIRLLDTCQRYDVNLTLEYMRKCLKNAERPYRHGDKRA